MNFRILVVLSILHREVKGDATGIRLCERECRLLKGCSAIRYDPVHLICTTLTNKQRNQRTADKGVVLIAKDMPAEEPLKTCNTNDVILFNKLTSPVCVPTGHTPVAEDVRNPRMLIIPKDSSRTFGLAIDLVNWEVTEFESSLQSISAVAHLKYLNGLLIAIRNNVFVSNPSFQQVTIFKRGLYVNKICVDERRKFVFVLKKTKTRKSNLMCCSYSAQVIKRFPVIAFNMEIDTKFKTVYALSGVRLFLYSYKGRMINTIGMDMRDATALACKPGLLYYSFNKDMLLKKVTKSGTVSTIGPLQQPHLPLCTIIDMTASSRYLYITCLKQNNFIIRVDLSDPKNVISRSLMNPSASKGFLFAGEM